MKNGGYFDSIIKQKNELDLDAIASKLTLFQEQVKLVHWKTTSYAEHKALDSLYDFLVEFKDDVIEKLMGYTGQRVSKITVGNIVPQNSIMIVNELLDFSMQLKEYGDKNNYQDICNLSDSLSGEAAKIKYLLSLQ